MKNNQHPIEKISIKKYSNRRLYNCSTSKYINLKDLIEIITKNHNVKIEDHLTGEDLTQQTLSLLIYEDNNPKKPIFSENFIKNFQGKILNIHPSLLPKFKGLNTHERAIKNKEKFSGCTVHYVNSKVDSGTIILQKKVRISKGETPKTLNNKILIQEHKLYPRAIAKVFNS